MIDIFLFVNQVVINEIKNIIHRLINKVKIINIGFIICIEFK